MIFNSSKSTRIARTALLPYTAEQIYALVADVERYPAFLPWCRSVQVLERSDESVCASMEIAKGPIAKSMTTRNVLRPFEGIELNLVDGPFRHFAGRWSFTPQNVSPTSGAGGCEVKLELEFEIAGALLRGTLGPIFGEIANTMVGAFRKRADVVYGRR